MLKNSRILPFCKFALLRVLVAKVEKCVSPAAMFQNSPHSFCIIFLLWSVRIKTYRKFLEAILTSYLGDKHFSSLNINMLTRVFFKVSKRTPKWLNVRTDLTVLFSSIEYIVKIIKILFLFVRWDRLEHDSSFESKLTLCRFNWFELTMNYFDWL